MILLQVYTEDDILIKRTESSLEFSVPGSGYRVAAPFEVLLQGGGVSADSQFLLAATVGRLSRQLLSSVNRRKDLDDFLSSQVKVQAKARQALYCALEDLPRFLSFDDIRYHIAVVRLNEEAPDSLSLNTNPLHLGDPEKALDRLVARVKEELRA